MNLDNIIKEDLEAIKKDLKESPNVNKKNEFGNNALHIACKNNSIEVVKILLDYPIDIEAKGIDDYTPLLYAASNLNHEILELLIGKNANINCQDDNGNSAILTAVMQYVDEEDYKAIKILLENGADPYLPNKFGILLFKFINMPAKKDLAPLFEAYQK